MNWDLLLTKTRLRNSKGRSIADARNDFESDFGRIIFSPAIRRMHDKTQVFPLTTDDNIHSRLTHSMEVMSVGFSMGIKLCEEEAFLKKFSKDKFNLIREVPVLLKNVCLIHDIGNPPFGHFGETVIQNYFQSFFKKSCVNLSGRDLSTEEKQSKKVSLVLSEEQQNDFLYFDGNAQGLRVLTKLQVLNDKYGLNLTLATLASYIKYPNLEPPSKKSIAKSKKGVSCSEKDYFYEIAKGCGLKIGNDFIRHPFCFLMEAADSICYLTMDIEDGFSKGLISIDYIYEKLKNSSSISGKLSEIFLDKDKIYKNDVTKMVNFRIVIIQRLVNLSIQNFITNIDSIAQGNYQKELLKDDIEELAKQLGIICKEKIFSSREINSLEITGHSVIKGLLDYYIEFLFHENKAYKKRALALLSSSTLKATFEENNLLDTTSNFDNFEQLNDYNKLRVIVDFISGMTDQYALNHFQKISGQKIT